MIRIITLLIITFFLNACGQEQSTAEQPQKVKEDYSKKSEESSHNTDNKLNTRNFSIAPDDIVMGDPQSKVVVMEYFAPTCPHCDTYHKKIFPEIKAKYIDTNKIAYVMREFIGNKQDLDATLLSRCKGDIDSYLKFVSILLSKQDNWAFNKNYREILTNIGSLGSVSPESFAKCLNNQDKIQFLIENTKFAASLPNFIGTPSFFINGVHFNEKYTVEDLSKAIEKHLTSP